MKKRFCIDDNDKKHHKAKYDCSYTGKYRGAAHDICNLRYKTPKEIPVVFDNGSAYDDHFIIKELAEEFEGQNILHFQYRLKKGLIMVNQLHTK